MCTKNVHGFEVFLWNPSVSQFRVVSYSSLPFSSWYGFPLTERFVNLCILSRSALKSLIDISTSFICLVGSSMMLLIIFDSRSVINFTTFKLCAWLITIISLFLTLFYRFSTSFMRDICLSAPRTFIHNLNWYNSCIWLNFLSIVVWSIDFNSKIDSSCTSGFFRFLRPPNSSIWLLSLSMNVWYNSEKDLACTLFLFYGSEMVAYFRESSDINSKLDSAYNSDFFRDPQWKISLLITSTLMPKSPWPINSSFLLGPQWPYLSSILLILTLKLSHPVPSFFSQDLLWTYLFLRPWTRGPKWCIFLGEYRTISFLSVFCNELKERTNVLLFMVLVLP